MFPDLISIIEQLDIDSISKSRFESLNEVRKFVQEKVEQKKPIELNFICTHNSRRSVLGQVWAKTMAEYYAIPQVNTYSGGTERTAVYPAIIATLGAQGFEINPTEGQNPLYEINFGKDLPVIHAYSKTYDDSSNPSTHFAAIMTCNHADENCPLILDCERRIPLTYEDPKAFDNTSIQMEKYEERSLQIATEMKYIFSKIEVK